jgi:TPR repeat protein
MTKKPWLTLVFLLHITLVYAGKGTLWVASDKQGAYIYVNGEKKAMTGEGYSSILLEEGEYIVKVEKVSDNETRIYRKSKKVFIGAETSVKFRFNLLALKRTQIQLFDTYKAGCNDKNISTCINLGYMYEKGHGIEQSHKEALHLYQKSCDSNHSLGCSNLGYMYENGYAIEQNTSKALELYTLSCEKNNTLGCQNHKILKEIILESK